MSEPEIVIETYGGNCPVQADGTVNGKPFYFRARGQRWSMSIGGDDVIGKPEWYHQEAYGDTEFAAGWMEWEEALTFLRKAAAMYVWSKP